MTTIHTPQERQQLTPDQQRQVEKHLGLASRMCKRFKALGRSRGVSPEDLRQEAYLGLCVAALRFDPTRQVSFQTYAFNWVRKYVEKAIQQSDATPVLEDADALPDEDGKDFAEGTDEDGPSTDLLHRLLGQLDERERQVVDMACGLSDKSYSFQAIAIEMRLSSRRVRIIYQKAMGKMEKVKK